MKSRRDVERLKAEVEEHDDSIICILFRLQWKHRLGQTLSCRSAQDT